MLLAQQEQINQLKASLELASKENEQLKTSLRAVPVAVPPTAPVTVAEPQPKRTKRQKEKERIARRKAEQQAKADALAEKARADAVKIEENIKQMAKENQQKRKDKLKSKKAAKKAAKKVIDNTTQPPTISEQSALQGTSTGVKYYNTNNLPGFQFFSDTATIDQIKARIRKSIADHGGVIANLFAMCDMSKKVVVSSAAFGAMEEKIVNFKYYYDSPRIELTSDEDLDTEVSDSIDYIRNQIEDQQKGPSGPILEKVSYIELTLASYVPIKGSSYIELPKMITNGCTNIRNDDDMRFAYSVCASLQHTENRKNNIGNTYGKEPNAERVQQWKKQFEENKWGLNWNGIEFPVSVSHIKKFERQNPDYAVFVYFIDNGKLMPFKTKRAMSVPQDKRINLLLLSDDTGASERRHYVCIDDMSAAFSKYFSDNRKNYICEYCCRSCTSQEILDKHTANCNALNDDALQTLPEPGTFEKFKKKRCDRLIVNPFVLYYDFEALLPKYAGPQCENSKSHKIHRHSPCGYGIYVVNRTGIKEYDFPYAKTRRRK